MLAMAQVVGASVGYGLLMFITPEDIFVTAGDPTCMTLPRDDISLSKAFFIEFLLTCALVLLNCGIWDPRNRKNGDSTPIRIGLTVVALSIAGGGFTGASMNPARSFGPALWNWNWHSHWIYWAGPMTATVVASYMYKRVFWRENPEDEIEESVPTHERKFSLDCVTK